MLKYIQGILQTIWREKSLTKSKLNHGGGNTTSHKKKPAINSQLMIPATNNEKYNVTTSQEIMELKKTYDMIMKKFVNPRLDLMSSNKTMLEQIILSKLNGKDLFNAIASSFFGVKRQTEKELTASDEKHSEDKGSAPNEPTFGWLGQPIKEMASKPMVEVSSLPLDIESALFVFPDKGKINKSPKKRHLKRNTLQKQEKYPISTDSYQRDGSLDLVKYIPKSKIETLYERNAQKQKHNEMRGLQYKNNIEPSPSKMNEINENTECSINYLEESCNIENRTQADKLEVFNGTDENDVKAKEKYDETITDNLTEPDFGNKLENHLLGNNKVGSYDHFNPTDEKCHVYEKTLLNTDHVNINYNENGVVETNRLPSGHRKKKRKKSQNIRLNELTHSKDYTIYNSFKQSGLVNTGIKPNVKKNNAAIRKSETRQNKDQDLNNSPSIPNHIVSNINNLEVINNKNRFLNQQQKRKHQDDNLQGKVENKSQKYNKNKTVETKETPIKTKNKKQGRTRKIAENGAAVLSDYLKYVKNKAWYYSQGLKVKENSYNSNTLIDISKNKLEANQSKNYNKNKRKTKSLPNLRGIKISLPAATRKGIKSKSSLNASKYKSESSLPVPNHVGLKQKNTSVNLLLNRSNPNITQNSNISESTIRSTNSITDYKSKIETTCSKKFENPHEPLTITNCSTTSNTDKKRKVKDVLEKKKTMLLEDIHKNNTFSKIIYNNKNRKLHTKKQQNTISNLKMYGAESSNVTADLKSLKSVQIVVKKYPNHSKQLCTTNFSSTVKKLPIKRNNEPSIQIKNVFSKRMQTRNLFTIEHNTAILFNYFCRRYATVLANETNRKESTKVNDKYTTLFKVKPIKHKTIIGNFSDYNNATDEATPISKIGTASKVNTAYKPSDSKIIETRQNNVVRGKHSDINCGSGILVLDKNYKPQQHKNNNNNNIDYISKKSDIIKQSENYKNPLVENVYYGNKQKINTNKQFNSTNQDVTNAVKTTSRVSGSINRNQPGCSVNNTTNLDSCSRKIISNTNYSVLEMPCTSVSTMNKNPSEVFSLQDPNSKQQKSESVRNDTLSSALNTTNINSYTSPTEINRDDGKKVQDTTQIGCKTSKASEESFTHSYLSSALLNTWKCKTDRLLNWADKVPRSKESCIKRKTQIKSFNIKGSPSDNIFGILNIENKSTKTKNEEVQKEDIHLKNKSEQSNTITLINKPAKLLFTKDIDRSLILKGIQEGENCLQDNSIKPIEKTVKVNLNKYQINSVRNKSNLESDILVDTKSKHDHYQINCQNNHNFNPKNKNVPDMYRLGLNQDDKHKGNGNKVLRREYNIDRNRLEDVENKQVENACEIDTNLMGENKNQIMDRSVLLKSNLKSDMNKCRTQNVLLPAINTNIVSENVKQNVKEILEPKKFLEKERFSALNKPNNNMTDKNTCGMLLENKIVSKPTTKNAMLLLNKNIYKIKNNNILENNSTSNNNPNCSKSNKYILEVQEKNILSIPKSSKKTNKHKIQTKTLQRGNQQKTQLGYQTELKVNKIELNNYLNLSELQPISKNNNLTCSLHDASCHNSDTFADNNYVVGSQMQDMELPVTLQKRINKINKHIMGTPKSTEVVKDVNENNVKKNSQHPIMGNRKINVIGKEHVKRLDNQKPNAIKNILNIKGSNDPGNKLSNTCSKSAWAQEDVHNPNILFIEKYQPSNDITNTLTKHPIEKESVMIKFPLTINLRTENDPSTISDDSNKILKLDCIKNELCDAYKEKHNRINIEPLKFNDNLVNIIKESKSCKPQRRLTMMK